MAEKNTNKKTSSKRSTNNKPAKEAKKISLKGLNKNLFVLELFLGIAAGIILVISMLTEYETYNFYMPLFILFFAINAFIEKKSKGHCVRDIAMMISLSLIWGLIISFKLSVI